VNEAPRKIRVAVHKCFSDRHAQEQPARTCGVLLLVTTFWTLTIAKVATLLEFVGVRYLLTRGEYGLTKR